MGSRQQGRRTTRSWCSIAGPRLVTLAAAMSVIALGGCDEGAETGATPVPAPVDAPVVRTPPAPAAVPPRTQRGERYTLEQVAAMSPNEAREALAEVGQARAAAVKAGDTALAERLSVDFTMLFNRLREIG